MISIIYEYAHEYQIPTVLAKAEKIIVNILENLRFSNWGWDTCKLNIAFNILAFAEKYDNNEIRSKAIARIACVPESDFQKHSTYKCLSPDIKVQLLEKRLALCQIETVFDN